MRQTLPRAAITSPCTDTFCRTAQRHGLARPAYTLNGILLTGASKLGIVPEFKHYGVPFTDPAVPFSVFPGSPAINDQGTIAFKGNYSENGVEKTGIFTHKLPTSPGDRDDAPEPIANSDTAIPNGPPSFQTITFGSTAPPSSSTSSRSMTPSVKRSRRGTICPPA